MQHLAVRVKPISFALRACFLGQYRMARMSQSASSCGLASWMRPQMIPDTHLLKLLFLARYTPRSICILLISIRVVLWICCLDAPAYDSGHSFAKIPIPCTILPLALFTFFLYLPTSFYRLTSWIYIAAIYYCDVYPSLLFHKKIQNSLYSGRIFAKIK